MRRSTLGKRLKRLRGKNMQEAWNEYYSLDDIKQIQRIELNSLDMLMGVCERLGIKFLLYGGSLLGAIKYNGFVPWDDDLDIAMLREDYEKFIKEGPLYLPENYEIQHPKTNKKTPFHYVKLRRTDTEICEYKTHKININHGVYFDIYPIDNIPDSYSDLLSQKMLYDKWVHIFQIRQNYRLDSKIGSPRDVIKLAIRMCQSGIAHLFSVSYLINRIDSISQKYNGINTLFQGNLSFPKPVNFFDGVDYVEARFENRCVYIPSGYKLNLRNRYGDIRRLPNEDKRVGHRPCVLKLDGGNQ